MVKNIYPKHPSSFRFSDKSSVKAGWQSNIHKVVFAVLILAFGCLSTTYGQMTYCLPSYEQASCASGDYITSFQFNSTSHSINEGSIQCPSSSSYPNFNDSASAVCAYVCAGATYTFTIGATTEFGAGTYVALYADFNQDNNFSDPGDFVFSNFVSSGQTISGTVTIPAGAVTGATRMRIICQRSSGVGRATCRARGSGENSRQGARRGCGAGSGGP